MSLIVAPEEDRLRAVEAEEGRRRFEDTRRLVGGRVGVLDLVILRTADTLLFGCRGVNERLS